MGSILIAHLVGSPVFLRRYGVTEGFCWPSGEVSFDIRKEQIGKVTTASRLPDSAGDSWQWHGPCCFCLAICP